MTEQELLHIIQGGESSKVQFKELMPHPDSLAHELIAFSNSHGGIIIFGVNDKTGELKGLSFGEIRELNQQLVNIASQKVYPPINIETETISLGENKIVVVNVAEGISKPYKDSSGIIYVKNGSDKRKVTSNDELARLLRSGGELYAEEMLVRGSSIDDIDMNQFNSFLKRKYNKSFDELHSEIEQLLYNLNLAQDGVLTLTGLLLFSNKRHLFRPQFSVQCVSVDGSLIGNSYTDNEGMFEGTLQEVFQRTIDFIGRSMRKVPDGNGFNSPSKWEIPHEVFEELVVNALVHRDYFISATTKVFIFSDRLEIISPGKLPNSLTVEKIKNGVAIARNPILLSQAQYILPYKGLGTGIQRSYSLYKNIDIENLADQEQFKVTIKRGEKLL